VAEKPLNKIADVIGGQLEALVLAGKISLLNAVVRDTRVDTGRLKGNWQVGHNSSAGQASILRKDKTGSKVRVDIVATVRPDGVDYLTNNLVYAEVWEERDGMVAKNAARVEQLLRRKLGAVR